MTYGGFDLEEYPLDDGAPGYPPMIEVTLTPGGSAEAATPEEAIFAARTIGREARKHARTQGFNPTITFAVDGRIVRTTTLRDLDR